MQIKKQNCYKTECAKIEPLAWTVTLSIKYNLYYCANLLYLQFRRRCSTVQITAQQDKIC